MVQGAGFRVYRIYGFKGFRVYRGDRGTSIFRILFSESGCAACMRLSWTLHLQIFMKGIFHHPKAARLFLSLLVRVSGFGGFGKEDVRFQVPNLLPVPTARPQETHAHCQMKSSVGHESCNTGLGPSTGMNQIQTRRVQSTWDIHGIMGPFWLEVVLRPRVFRPPVYADPHFGYGYHVFPEPSSRLIV